MTESGERQQKRTNEGIERILEALKSRDDVEEITVLKAVVFKNPLLERDIIRFD